MIIPIKSDISQSLKAYLQILNPVLKLKDKEIEVLSNFLSIWHKNKNNKDLDKLLFSMSEASFNNHITMLRKKKMIVDKKINSSILEGVKDTGIEITYKIQWTN